MKTTLDLYTDYLAASFGPTTATGLSRLLEGSICHDDVTDFLNTLEGSSKALWHQVKPLVRQIEHQEGVLIFDDSIAEKAHSDINGLIAVHYDHSKGRYVKGVNLLTALYQVGSHSVPIGFELIIKHLCSDIKSKKQVWKATYTKNELYRNMLKIATKNKVQFKYVLQDSWFCNAENINYVLHLKKHLITAMKSNMEIALSLKDKQAGKFIKMSQLPIEVGSLQKVYIRSVASPLYVCKDIFINKDDSEAILYLLTTDASLTYQQVISTYQRRWAIEDYHKSLKQNAALTKSPTKTIKTQSNHLFAAICTFVKLEKLKMEQNLNHFALKSKLYVKAIQAAFQELQRLKPNLA